MQTRKLWDKGLLTCQCHMSVIVVSFISLPARVPAQMPWFSLSWEVHGHSPTLPYSSELCALLWRWPTLTPLPWSFPVQKLMPKPANNWTTHMKSLLWMIFSRDLEKHSIFTNLHVPKMYLHLLSHLSKVIRWVEDSAVIEELQGENISGIFWVLSA